MEREIKKRKSGRGRNIQIEERKKKSTKMNKKHKEKCSERNLKREIKIHMQC